MKRSTSVWGMCVALTLGLAAPAVAQDPQPPQPPQTPPAQTTPPPQTTPPQPATPPQQGNPDARVDVLQPDFVLASLPTTLRLPEYKLSFRVTHRFNRPLGKGDIGDLVSDFFGFDSGAQIGLELRYGLLPGTQVGIYRTSDRTIQLFGQQSLMQQKPDGHPLGIDVIVTLEGLNNLQGEKSGAFGLLVSRKVGGILAVYAEPIFIANTNFIDDPGSSNNTGMIGLGGRLRIRPKVYVVGEFTPRFSGYQPGTNQGSFGLEVRSGGHLFQINFSNGLGTTLGQISRGGIDASSWMIGFNISRKFY